MSEQETETIRHRARGFFRRDEKGILPYLKGILDKLEDPGRVLNVLVVPVPYSVDSEKKLAVLLDSWKAENTHFGKGGLVASLTKAQIEGLEGAMELMLMSFPYTPRYVSSQYSKMLK